MATNILAEILQWWAFQPLWQRDALRPLLLVGALTSADFDALTEICKSVHGLALSPKMAYLFRRNICRLAGRRQRPLTTQA
jgi:hypothetical protein